MVEEIGATGHDRPERLPRGEKAKNSRSESATKGRAGDEAPEVVVSSELKELVDRVRQADVYRKERVHQVLEKLQRGELVTSEAVREAAEKILREGI
ncbi:MAG: flagellar biosynthesis anti-sigma factor FlgM [Planctomycetota bacterium]|jgi:hypothetical protein